MHTYIVRLNNIRLKATHGVYEREKLNKQLFEVDIEAHLIEKETCYDDIRHSVDYHKIYKILLDVFNNNSFNLIETLGEKVIRKMFKNNNIKSAVITIRKPEIQFDDNSNCVEVSISGSNE